MSELLQNTEKELKNRSPNFVSMEFSTEVSVKKSLEFKKKSLKKESTKNFLRNPKSEIFFIRTVRFFNAMLAGAG